MKKVITIISAIFLFSTFLNAQLRVSEGYRKALDEQYTSGLFTSDNSYMVVPADDPSSLGTFNVFQYLQGKIPGLLIYKAGTFSPSVYWRNSRTSFFLDQVQVEASVLSTISLQDIGLIKVFRPPFMGAFGGGSGGAIAVYTVRVEGEEEEELE